MPAHHADCKLVGKAKGGAFQRPADTGRRQKQPTMSEEALILMVTILMFQGPPKALDEDVVQIPGFAVHEYLRLCPLQPVCPFEGCEL